MAKQQALIVEDNKLNGEIIATLLEKSGMETVSIPSPQQIPQALARMENLRVIFLDLEFPNADGFDVQQDLKRNANLDGVPVVAYTVHTSEIDRARRTGFHSFLGKPLDPDRFPAQLARILNGEAVWEAG